MKKLITLLLTLSSVLAAPIAAPAPDWQGEKFRLSSSDFKDGGVLPISAISNYIVNNANACSLDGSPGLNESPQLSWTHAPRSTQSFVVTVFDVTAGVTHWGMYNISPEITTLPQGAGVTGSSYGPQVVNVFSDQSYDGPCPPANYPPNTHHYV